MACNHFMAPANTGNDGDAPLAVAVTKGFGDTDSACNHSIAPANTGNDGDTPLAVVVTKGLSDIDLTQFNINGPFPFNELAIELQNKIIEYSMTATDREIKFPCLTNAGYTPNITVGLLLANHRIYHEAHYQLRKQNTFVFGNLGSDLKTLVSSVGPFKCRSGACGYGRLCPVLPKVNFNLGDDELPSDGENKAHAFGCALRYLRPELTISSLHISLAYHSFRNSAQLSVFASALRKLKVQDAFTIDGDEKYLEMSFGDLPSNLDMKLMPVNVKFTAYNPTIQYSPGRFLHRYEPEESVCSDTVGAQLAG